FLTIILCDQAQRLYPLICEQRCLALSMPRSASGRRSILRPLGDRSRKRYIRNSYTPMSATTTALLKYVNYLWDDQNAGKLSPAERLVYRSNLLGSDQRITNTGGGNTSAKIT